MRYITPAWIRRAEADGVPIIGLTDPVLARYVARSEAAIDAYLGLDLLAGGGMEPHTVPFVQQGFDMKGGFGARKLRIPTPLVPVRNVARIQIHISNASPGGEPLLAILEPGEVVINNWEGYCEVIALTLTYSLSAVIWELGTDPPIAEWDLAVGHYIAYWQEPLYDSGDGLHFYAVPQFWAGPPYAQASSAQPATLPPVPPVVYVNGVPQLSCVLAAPGLTAGDAVSALPVAPLTAALPAGTQLIIHDGSGNTSAALTCTVAAPGAGVGATSVPLSPAFTPAASYPAASTVLGAGYAVNYTEGGVTFAASNSQSGNTITANVTGQIHPLVQEAAMEQTVYLLQQRALNQMGLGGLEQVRSGQQQIRRAKTDDAEEDGLCAKARLKLAAFRSVAIA